ncbi:hypothetical protein ACU5AX_04495 [Sphingomonas sp. XXL09]|uniref:hypothetical protein n=1 Tax=Sphingomonas sp. XXL09 TaxID=3457787 RepID=UPI00406BAA77
MSFVRWWQATLAVALALAGAPVLAAHSLREAGKTVQVADSALSVTPTRDWNRLSGRPGRYAETWTLDGSQLNDVSFYANVPAGQPIIRARNRRRDPLPLFRADMLLADVPELLEGTYRTYKQIGSFSVTASSPARFLDHDAVQFSYAYLDVDELPRRGEAIATIIDRHLYMITFDAPRLHFFDRSIGDVRALINSCRLGRGEKGADVKVHAS